MNQKLVFCIVFLIIFCCDISMSSAAVENNVGDFDDINKTLTIYDNESTVMTVRLISAVSDIGTFTEIFEVSNFEAYIPDSKSDFTARTNTKVGIGDVIGIEWFIEQNVSYVVNVTDYGIKEVEEIIYNNKTGKNETVLINKTVITGYHDETRYKDVWVDYQLYDKVMLKDQVQRIKVVYHKTPELGPFRIQTVPMFRGVECPELTWWSGSWDRRRAILIDNTVGDSVTDYQLRSVNLSSFGIDAVSSRIINETSGSEESFWNGTVYNGDLEYVWCNFSSLPSGGWINSTYYIYYQSAPAASSVSSGNATFIQYHNSTSTLFKMTNVKSPPMIVEWHMSMDSVSNNNFAGVDEATNYDSLDSIYINVIPSYTFRVVSFNEGSYTGTYVAGTPSVDSIYKIILDGTNALCYRDDVLKHTATTNIPTGEQMGLFLGGITSPNGVLHWSFIRKYTNIEPEPWTVGSEENYTPTPTPTPAPTISVSPAQYDELDLPLVLYILMISLLYLFVAFRNGVATIELSLIYLIFAFFFLLFQTITISVNYIYITLFLLLFLISIAGITKQGVD